MIIEFKRSMGNDQNYQRILGYFYGLKEAKD
jgi:hypothetical protein